MGVTRQGNKLVFNGVKKDFVLGRSSFKLANIVSYHYTGQGGGKYSLGYAKEWIAHNQRIFGKDVVLRVFLETAGWDPQSKGMFGSAPQDQGVMGNREQYRDGTRTKNLHGVAKDVIEWFFKTSEETGVAFELVIDATLKHDDIPPGEIDHIIRVVGVYMGEMAVKYPKALIIPETRNEWNAHANTPLSDVNMWAERWWRDDYWNDAVLIVSPGGGNVPTYKIGGNGYKMAIIHPERGKDWEKVPLQTTAKLRGLAFNHPVGYNESMYLVEREDLDRVRDWYRPSGWTADFGKWRQFYENAKSKVDYFIIHDEKGAQCDPSWPRPLTRMEKYFLGDSPPPPPPPDPVDPPPPVDPPDPDPDPDWEKLLELFGIGGNIVKRVEDELHARGEQLDRIEAGVSALLSSPRPDPGGGPTPEPPEPPSPGPSEPDRSETQYIPWNQRQKWADRVEQAYSVWRGGRDLAYLVAHGARYLKGGTAELVPLTSREILQKVGYMDELHEEQNRLVYRIVTEKHRKYEGRSQVRKDVANALISRLQFATADYSSVRSYIPYDSNYDSIRGFINSRG